MKFSKRLLSLVVTVAMLATVIGVLPMTASAKPVNDDYTNNYPVAATSGIDYSGYIYDNRNVTNSGTEYTIGAGDGELYIWSDPFKSSYGTTEIVIPFTATANGNSSFGYMEGDQDNNTTTRLYTFPQGTNDYKFALVPGGTNGWEYYLYENDQLVDSGDWTASNGWWNIRFDVNNASNNDTLKVDLGAMTAYTIDSWEANAGIDPDDDPSDEPTVAPATGELDVLTYSTVVGVTDNMTTANTIPGMGNASNANWEMIGSGQAYSGVGDSMQMYMQWTDNGYAEIQYTGDNWTPDYTGKKMVFTFDTLVDGENINRWVIAGDAITDNSSGNEYKKANRFFEIHGGQIYGFDESLRMDNAAQTFNHNTWYTLYLVVDNTGAKPVHSLYMSPKGDTSNITTVYTDYTMDGAFNALTWYGTGKFDGSGNMQRGNWYTDTLGVYDLTTGFSYWQPILHLPLPSFALNVPATGYLGDALTISGTVANENETVEITAFGDTYYVTATGYNYTLTLDPVPASAERAYTIIAEDESGTQLSATVTLSEKPSIVYQNDFELCDTSWSYGSNDPAAFNNHTDATGFRVTSQTNYGQFGIYEIDGDKVLKYQSGTDNTQSAFVFQPSVLGTDETTLYQTSDSLQYTFNFDMDSASDTASSRIEFGLNSNGTFERLLRFGRSVNWGDASSGFRVYYYPSGTETQSSTYLTVGEEYQVRLVVKGISGALTYSAYLTPSLSGEEITICEDQPMTSSARGDFEWYCWQGDYSSGFRNDHYFSIDDFVIEAPKPEEKVEINFLEAIKHSDDLEAMAFITQVVIPATKTATLYMKVGRAATFAFATDMTGITVNYAAYIDNIPSDKRDVEITCTVDAVVDQENEATQSATASWNTARDINDEGQIASNSDLAAAAQMLLSSWKSSWSTQ